MTGKNRTCRVMDFDVETNQSSLVQDERWSVVHTLPHRQWQALVGKAQGFRIFLPRHLKNMQHVGRLNAVSAPFFLRYLFVAFDLRRGRCRSVYHSFSVGTPMMGEEYPFSIPADVVEGSGRKLQHRRSSAAHSLKLAERVRILTGPFAALFRKITRFEKSVRVLPGLLGGMLTVRISPDALAAVWRLKVGAT
jgi:hypothetical protein